MTDKNLGWRTSLEFQTRFLAIFKNEFFLIEEQFYESSTADIEYRPIESDWVFGLRAQNLFNTGKYTFASVSDFQQTELIYRAIPRYVLSYVKLRF